jgi:hypothetical protein
MAKGELIAALDFSNVAEDEFNDWYDQEHIPNGNAFPVFSAAIAGSAQTMPSTRLQLTISTASRC